LNSRINGSTFEDISFLPTFVELSDITDDKPFLGISKQNGVVYGQGSLDTGKLGVNSSGLSFSDIYSYPFVPIKSSSEFNNSGVSQAAISARHSIFLKENSLYATGDFTGTNKYPTSEVVAVNMTILAGKTIKNIYGAHKTSIVVTQDNQMYFFGGNIFPFGGTTSPQLALVNTTIMGNQTIQDVRCGTDFCIFQTEQGNVFGSGLNSDGQLCDGSKTNPPFIVQSNLAKINGSLKQIAAGRYHTLFLSFSGLVYGAGSNNRKQLGFTSSSFTDYTEPTQMIATNVLTHPITQSSNLTGSFIAAGGEISLIITTDGRFLIFGYRQESYFNDENTIIFSDPRPEPIFITIPLLTNEKIRSVVIRPRTMYFLTEFFCFGISDKNSSVCSGKGKCTNADTCSCDTGYGSPSCNTTICFGTLATDPNVCSGRGSCRGVDTCNCTLGYTGNNCNTSICFGKQETDPNVCNSHGKCQSPDNCNCTTGFTGNQCQMNICFGKNSSDSTVCSGRGSCQSPNNCNCTLGYTGNQCQMSICFSKNSSDTNVCSGRGSCQSPDNCNCTTGFTGNQCQMSICFGKNSSDSTVCSGRGSCQSPNNCNCTLGYTGNQCQMNICFGKNSSDSNVCSGKGSCDSPDKCNCTLGYWKSMSKFHLLWKEH
jgi:hypothetical protein